MNIENALDKLNALLPLKERQQALQLKYRESHRDILNSFASKGKAPDNIEQSVLNTLSENDLVVLGEHGEVVGAYPFSLRETAHQVFNDSFNLYAMCAFDAIAIAPVFNIQTNIISRCHLSNEIIEVTHNVKHVTNVQPSKNIYIGIRWQSAGSCAADNLCMEMVFLKDEQTANQWQNNDQKFSIFALNDAIEFAVKYFKPLLTD